MPNTELLVKLRDLHEELSSINDDLKSAEQVEEETIEALGQLVTDVNNLVDSSNRSEAGKSIAEEHGALYNQVMEFDSKHPRVAMFLSQVTDVLAMIGI